MVRRSLATTMARRNALNRALREERRPSPPRKLKELAPRNKNCGLLTNTLK